MHFALFQRPLMIQLITPQNKTYQQIEILVMHPGRLCLLTKTQRSPHLNWAIVAEWVEVTALCQENRAYILLGTLCNTCHFLVSFQCYVAVWLSLGNINTLLGLGKAWFIFPHIFERITSPMYVFFSCFFKVA